MRDAWTVGSGPAVLVVEDDEGIGRSLARTLEGQGYRVDWARTGADALALTRTDTAVVILDLGLPDVDGLDVCRQLRARAPAPQVLVLTARRDEADVVLGLDAGADDYLVKPFRLAELLARVRACARRVDADRDHLAAADLRIDVEARTVETDAGPVELRPKEFDLLVALAREAGRVVPRERLMADVWDEHWFGSTKTLDIHVWALRRKLDDAGRPSRITTVRGVGYRLEPE
jgi:DNA-binding response OmpR family regulator